MESTSLWSALLDTYLASPDIIKALWVLVPPAFLLGVVAVLRPRRGKVAAEEGELLYSIRRNRDGVVTVHYHGAPEGPAIHVRRRHGYSRQSADAAPARPGAR